MALIIEDGSIVANANTYATLIEFDAYLDARSITLYQEDGTTELTDAQKEALLINSFDWMNTYEPNYIGYRVNKNQTGSFPRVGLEINGFTYSSSEIPAVVKTVQIAAATESGQDVDLYNSGATISSESVGIGSGAITESKTYKGGKVETIRESVRLMTQLFGGGGVSIPLIKQ